MTDEKNRNNEDKNDDVLETDPLTGGKTTAQQPTDDEQIQPLPTTTNEDGDETRAGDFDTTTGAAHPNGGC